MRTFVALFISCSLLAQAQTAEPVTPLPPPAEAVPTPSAPPMPVVAPGVPPSFVDSALRVDRDNVITEGKAGTPVSHRELFTRLGRTDLLEKSDAAKTRRTALFIAAGGVLLAGAVTGIAFLATSPNLATPACENDVRVYNDICVPKVREHTSIGVGSLVGGVVGALLLGGIAFLSDPRVLNADATSRLVGIYNAQLLRKLRGETVTLVPVITNEGAAMSASLHF